MAPGGGGAVKISRHVASVLSRLQLVFFLNQSQDLSRFLVTDLGELQCYVAAGSSMQSFPQWLGLRMTNVHSGQLLSAPVVNLDNLYIRCLLFLEKQSGVVRYPPYPVSRSGPVFASRRQLEDYEEALEMAAEVRFLATLVFYPIIPIPFHHAQRICSWALQ
jgi:hypothetical protein